MISHLLESHRIAEAELSLTFVGRDRIRRLNREYLGRRGSTDVIAFDLTDPAESEKRRSPLMGDIYVCVPQAVSQAGTYGVSPEEEFCRLAAHGVLHLLGYDHESELDARRMNREQEAAVARFKAGAFG
jgi:probable rRNA maturation factor